MEYNTLKPLILTLGEEVLALVERDEELTDQITQRFSKFLSAVQMEYFDENDEPTGFLTKNPSGWTGG